MRIVLVDDESFVLQLLTRQLANVGARDVHACRSGREALDVIRAAAGAIDLVICDLQMPQMDGVEFLRHLAETGYTGAVALVSGEDERVLHTAHTLARAHRLNVQGVLPKPVTPEELGQVLSRVAVHRPVEQRGRRRVYGPEMLQEALASGQLVNYYQPKVDVATGVVVGVECLVRWFHPEDGLVYPDQFIGTAEEHGLIGALTRKVLTNALAQARVWLDAGLRLSVAVNISMDDLTDLEFPEAVSRAVRDAGVPLSILVLEVTESRLVRDPRSALDVLARLRLKRIRLSIDDFGTGHSSLAQLRDCPFDELKIDRGFVHGADHTAFLRAIFEASRRMARDLGMHVVAEGVEDRADWDFLRATSCDMAQGYFIARPMPGPDLIPWMLGWEDRRRSLVAAA